MFLPLKLSASLQHLKLLRLLNVMKSSLAISGVRKELKSYISENVSASTLLMKAKTASETRDINSIFLRLIA
jgi:hypothetical protein